MEKIKVEYRNTDEIIPYENNPRKNDEAVDYVANSIREFGFKMPIVVDKEGVIIAGHTRLKASKKLGLEQVPVIVADDLTEEQVKALRLADNKVGEIAEWDFNMLGEELANIDIDMEQFGFFEEIEEKIKKVKDTGDIPFSEVIGEEHNYIILYFDNDIDWLQAQSIFDIQPVKASSTRKDGKMNGKLSGRVGVGRVLKGAEAINKILGVKNEDIS